MVYPLHGGADHYFSEALYLADPDGNRIEIYHDRQKVWRDENGELPFVSNPLAGKNYCSKEVHGMVFHLVL